MECWILPVHAERITLDNGAFLFSDFARTWRLEIDVRAGERLEVSLGASGRAGGGYSVGFGVGALLPAGGLTQGVASLSALSDLGDTSEEDVASDFSALSDFTSGMTRLWLSAGLSLADESGLYRQGDGSYSFAPAAKVPPGAVPEPTSALLALGGLALLWHTRRKARA